MNSFSTCAVGFALLPLISALPVKANTYEWAGGDGFWDVPSNWNLNTIPAVNYPSGFNAFIQHDDSTSRSITFRRGTTGNNPTVLLFYLGVGNAGSGLNTLHLSDWAGVSEIDRLAFPTNQPHELITGHLWVGNDGSGSLNMTGGTLRVYNELILGKSTNDGLGNSGNASYNGLLNISGGDLYLNYSGQGGIKLFDIGREASGFVVQTGGHIHAQDAANQYIRLGAYPVQSNTSSFNSQYILGGGTLDAWNLQIGQNRDAKFLQSGGIHNVFQLDVGYDDSASGPDGAGLYKLSGGALSNLGNYTKIGENGTFEMTGGTMTTPNLQVNGVFDLRDGALEINGARTGGAEITGAFNQSGGMFDLVSNQNGDLEILAGGLYSLTGGTLKGGEIEVSGSLYHQGGTLDFSDQSLKINPGGGWTWTGGAVNAGLSRVVVDGLAVQSGTSGFFLNLDVGTTGSTNAYHTFTGDSTLNTGTIDVGAGGTGTIDIQNNSDVSAANLNIGQISGGTGSVIVRSGTLAGSFTNIGEGDSGSLDVRGGSFTASNELNLHANSELKQSGGTTTSPKIDLSGKIDATGGRISTDELQANFGSEITWNGNLVLADSLSSNQEADRILSKHLKLNGAVLTGSTLSAESGSLSILGNANRINATVNLVDTIISNEGTLRLEGNSYLNGGSISGSGHMVNDGSMRSGSAFISQDFTNNGNLFIDSGSTSSSHSVFVDGEFTQGNLGRIILSVLDPISLTSYDSVSFTKTVNLDGTLEIVLQDGFTVENGAQFTLFSYALDYSDFNNPFPLLNGTFDQIILPELQDGYSWDISELYTTGNLNIIPEPSTTLTAILFIIISTLQRTRKV